MSNVRTALADGFSGAGGEGGAQTPLDQLIELMYEIGGKTRLHPICALQYRDDSFPFRFSIDFKVEACKRILLGTEPESLQNNHAVELLKVREGYPHSYFAMALEDLQIDDFLAWIKPRTSNGPLIRPVFCAPRV